MKFRWQDILVGSAWGLFGGLSLSFAIAQTSAMRPDQFIAAAWTWTGAQTFGPVFGVFVTETTTARTISAADCGKTITFTNASASTATFPSTIASGCSVSIVQGHAAGTVTPTAGASATVRTNGSFTKTAGIDAIIGVANVGATAADWVWTGAGQ